MTLIVAFTENPEDSITILSDSRVSLEAPVLDSVAKLLPLTVKIVDNNQIELFNNTFGFAFAGSTLVAQSIYSFIATALQTLRSDEGKDFPSLEQISQFVSNMTEKIAKEYGRKITNPSLVNTSIFLFGFCHISNARKLFEIKTNITTTNFNVDVVEHDVRNIGSFYLIGDKKAIEHMSFLQNSGQGYNLYTALHEIVNSESYPGVGGSIQLFKADKLGARAIPTLHMTKRNTASLKLLNHNLDGVKVGSCHFLNKAVMLS